MYVWLHTRKHTPNPTSRGINTIRTPNSYNPKENPNAHKKKRPVIPYPFHDHSLIQAPVQPHIAYRTIHHHYPTFRIPNPTPLNAPAPIPRCISISQPACACDCSSARCESGRERGRSSGDASSPSVASSRRRGAGGREEEGAVRRGFGGIVCLCAVACVGVSRSSLVF